MSKIYGIELNLVYGFHIKKFNFFCEIVNFFTTTVAKSVGKFGKAIPYIGWGITAAICIWDIADYINTASEGKELLKQSLAQYFREVKTELLCSTDQSIMGSIINWENDVKTNIAN